MTRKHTVNGDQQNGWYCYECLFTTRDVALAAAHDGVNIRTSHDYPPIPMRQFDWSAWDDNTYDGAPDSGTRNQVGHGATEQEAINDLTETLARSTA